MPNYLAISISVFLIGMLLIIAWALIIWTVSVAAKVGNS